MATSTSDSELAKQVQDLVKCSICLETLRQPRTLPCSHTFCHECLTNWVKKKREDARAEGIEKKEFGCPDCRAPFQAETDESIQEIKCLHLVRNMLDAINIQQQAKKKTLVCFHCQVTAISYCCECEMLMCSKCFTTHQAWPSFKGHTLLTLDEMSKPGNQTKLRAYEVSTRENKSIPEATVKCSGEVSGVQSDESTDSSEAI